MLFEAVEHDTPLDTMLASMEQCTATQEVSTPPAMRLCLHTADAEAWHLIDKCALLCTLLQLEAVLICSARLEGHFDATLLAVKAGGHPLVAMGYWAFFQSGLLHAYAIDARTLIRLVHTMQRRLVAADHHSMVNLQLAAPCSAS